MSARDDYPLVNNSGAYQWHQMCDEIDNLRAEREALWVILRRVAPEYLASAPDEVNEEGS